MCFVLYMASDKERREIAWDSAAPSFHVRANANGATQARAQFSKANVYYLGAHEGCGCGFRRSELSWTSR